jgi:6-phosphogluconate dehydrogenase
MQLGMIGLGKMGRNMTMRLLRARHAVVAYDLDEDTLQQSAHDGAIPSRSLAHLVAQVEPPRALWMMLPLQAVEATIDHLVELLDKGDVLVDGGNSYYQDTLRRGDALAAQGIHYVDVGTSGGVWGLDDGYSLMVGGDAEAVAHLRPALETLAPAPDRGWGHVGRRGSGHFVKMVHNGIEYGLMEAYAEGFELLQRKPDFALDLHQVATIWRFGSVIRSWLLDLTAQALHDNPALEGIASYVADSGMGRWTVNEAVDLAVPVPVITLALQMRFRSQADAPFSGKLLAALRQQFGGHPVKQEEAP